MKHKVLLFLLTTLLLCVTILSLPVSAAQTSGTCGDNLTWTFEESSGTLTISGQGAMKFPGGSPGWKDLKKQIIRVVIQEGCTSVGEAAFYECTKMTSVSFPTTLKSIGKDAFWECSSLTGIPLDHITELGTHAFARCFSLQTLTIPKTMKTIGYGAFGNCRLLYDVTIQEGVTVIEGTAFANCYNLASITISDSVTTIGSHAFFDSRNLTTVNMGSGVTFIGDNAFSLCSRLKSIRIPDKVEAIKAETFRGCSALQEVIIGASVSFVDSSAFTDCPKLKAFTASENNTHFSTDQGVLYSKDKTVLWKMPSNAHSNYAVLPGTHTIRTNAFQGGNLQSLTLPASITAIEGSAFTGCQKLTSVYLSEGLQRIDASAFSDSGILQITIPSTVTQIDDFAFANCRSLKKITFTGPACKLSDTAFSGVTAAVYFPKYTDWQNHKSTYGGDLMWNSIDCTTHQTEIIPGKAPTCKETGLKEGSRCSICYTVFVAREEIPALDHNYGPWEVQTAPTEEKAGLAKQTCSLCGETQEKVLEYTPDTPTAGTEETTAPTQATPAPTEPTNPNVTEPDQEEPGPRWWVVVLIAGMVLLGAGITGMILIRGGKTVFKKE